MKARRRVAVLAGLVIVSSFLKVAAGENRIAPGETDLPAAVSGSEAQPGDPGAAAGGFLISEPRRTADPCLEGEIVASPTRPNWESGAATTLCGIVETDFGWTRQSAGGTVRQSTLASSIRYGLTPRIDLRLVLANRIAQTSDDGPALAGVGDQSVSATYRFHDQGRRIPALALSYGIKIPAANPAKGFGTGFTDHQLLMIVSRDLGRNHLDFNAVGNLAGGAHGGDGAIQFGLALTRQVSRRTAWIVDSYGGPQPGSTEKCGAILTGMTYSLRPWLVLDGAYAHTCSAGSPRQQVLFGVTYATRPFFRTIPRGSGLARLLGR